MLANLTIGHMFVIPLEELSRQRAKTGLLGADYCVRAGPDIASNTFTKATRGIRRLNSPLTNQEVVVAVGGEYLLAVGRSWKYAPQPMCSVTSRDTAGRPLALTVGPEAGWGGTRVKLTVVPLDTEYPLAIFCLDRRQPPQGSMSSPAGSG